MDYDTFVARVRDLAAKPPEYAEHPQFGGIFLRAGKKSFGTLGCPNGRNTITFKCTKAEQAELLEDDRFYVPHYVGHHGWTGLWPGDSPDWDEIELLLIRAYRGVALKRMLRALDD